MGAPLKMGGGCLSGSFAEERSLWSRQAFCEASMQPSCEHPLFGDNYSNMNLVE